MCIMMLQRIVSSSLIMQLKQIYRYDFDKKKAYRATIENNLVATAIIPVFGEKHEYMIWFKLPVKGVAIITFGGPNWDILFVGTQRIPYELTTKKTLFGQFTNKWNHFYASSQCQRLSLTELSLNFPTLLRSI